MKRILMMLVMLVPVLSSCATVELLDKSKIVPFQKIIEVPNTSKSDLFDKCTNWFVGNFKDVESVISYSNKDNDIFRGDIVTTLTLGEGLVYLSFKVKQLLIINIKENRVRITIENPFYYNTYYKMYKPIITKTNYDEIRSEWPKTVESLKEYLLKNSNDKDW
ncbi:MAG: DUF4468 domain-containing protein [Chlorobi bacterium]|nr:DUF4468 domain-containing protein [Chlorobiota bacterium]